MAEDSHGHGTTHAQANEHTPKKGTQDKLSKYKWYLIGGLAVIAVAVFYFTNQSNSNASTQSPSTTTGLTNPPATPYGGGYYHGSRGPGGPAGPPGPRGKPGPKPGKNPKPTGTYSLTVGHTQTLAQFANSRNWSTRTFDWVEQHDHLTAHSVLKRGTRVTRERG